MDYLAFVLIVVVINLFPETALTLGDTWSVVAVSGAPRDTSVSSWNTLLHNDSTDTAIRIQDSNGLIGSYEGSTFYSSGYDTDDLSNGAYILLANSTGNTTQFYINGKHVGSSNTKITSAISAIGNYSSGGQQWGDLGELMIFNRELNTSEHQEIFNYLADKWSICAKTAHYAGIPGNDMVLWLDADDVNGNCSNPSTGSTLATWYDKSGNTNNATQSGSAKPSYIANAVNGKAAVNFFSDYMDIGDLNTDMGTLFLVLSLNSTITYSTSGVSPFMSDIAHSDWRGIWLGNLTGSLTNETITINRGSNKLGLTNAGSIAQDEAFIISVPWNGSQYELNFNGELMPLTTLGTHAIHNMSDVSLGRGQVGEYYYEGKILELVAYSKGLGSQERRNVERYLAQKWNIPSALCSQIGDIPADGLELWLDAEDHKANCTEINGHNGGLSTWFDKATANGSATNNASQGGNPKVLHNSINGNIAIDFDGNDYYSISNDADLNPNNAGMTYFLVAQNDNPTSDGFMLHKGNGSDNLEGWSLYQSSSQSHFRLNPANATSNRHANNHNNASSAPMIYSSRITGTTQYSYVNGSSYDAQTYGSTYSNDGDGIASSASLYLAAKNGSSDYFNGKVGEVLIYGQDIGRAGQQAVEDYLSYKWGIPITNNHCSRGSDLPTDVVARLAVWLDAEDPNGDCSQLSDNTSLTTWTNKGIQGR